ncbi:MAG: serine hydrolase domain-containing protein [Hyphomicrobiales bacterium]
MTLEAGLARLIAAEIGRSNCHEAALCVMRQGETATAAGGAWNGEPVTADTPFLIASTSKLLVTAMIFRLADDGLIGLDDAVAQYFPGALDRLLVWHGKDLTGRITIRQLLTHSSGLPDYFEGRRKDGTRLADRLFAGHDLAYGLAEVIAWVRDEMTPPFAPGTGRRALYSDTNFYLLTALLAQVAERSPDAALEDMVTGPLGLTQTRFFHPGDATLPLRLGNTILDLPQALASMPGDGGAVSTALELALFGRAFFDGRLFDPANLAALADWRRVFFPLQAGLGVLRFHLPWFLPPFQAGLDFIGHSGISGAFVYHWPKRDVIVSGTVNQLQGRSRPYRIMVKAALLAGAD